VSSAIQAAEQAVSSNPRSVDARIARVRTLSIRAGDRPRAEEELRLLVSVFPGSPEVHHAVGELALAKDDSRTARTAFERAVELDGTSFESLNALIAIDVRGKRLPDARRRIDAALARDPSSARLLLLAGQTYAAAGDPRRAEQVIRKAIEIDSGSPEGYTALAALYLVERRLDDARREFITVAKQQSRSIAPATMVGILSEALGDPEGAIQWYERALAIDPRAATAANNLAWLYAQKGEKLDQALDLAQTAAAELPAIPEVSDTLAWVYYKKDLPNLALPILQRLVDQDPRNAIYHFHLGMVYAKRGEDLKARASIERALSLKPDFNGAADARRALASLLY
jgi:tetratricopeptide (TPR) repeat protein